MAAPGRIRHQHRRTADRREFGNRRGAGPANHQMRFFEPSGHVLEKGSGFGGDSQFRVAGPQRLLILAARLLHD